MLAKNSILLPRQGTIWACGKAEYTYWKPQSNSIRSCTVDPVSALPAASRLHLINRQDSDLTKNTRQKRQWQTLIAELYSYWQLSIVVLAFLDLHKRLMPEHALKFERRTSAFRKNSFSEYDVFPCLLLQNILHPRRVARLELVLYIMIGEWSRSIQYTSKDRPRLHTIGRSSDWLVGSLAT